MRRTTSLLAAGLLMLGTTLATAQTAPAQNPLRPANTRAATPAAAPAAATPAAEAPKPKRARSEAQLANDNRMKACGAEWRANKAALTAQGKTWKTYMPECRARMKAAGQ